MATKKSKTLYIDINVNEKSIVSKFLRKRTTTENYDSSDMKLLRKLFSDEKTRILYFLKQRKPTSIYDLARLLKRDFKSVYMDLKLLERFGFIEFYAEKNGKRESLKPVLLIDEIKLVISV